MNNKASGIKGEEIARIHYANRGYEILDTNFRYQRAEIDFIALTPEEHLLVFVEVKNRRRKDFGETETFVSVAQQNRIKEAAEEYIFGINWKKDIRFDILCVDPEKKIEWFQDAF